ncbi:uncharacterized protein VTP21DRAFT_2846 [Calcarisporiella thermophila]|uniref:uncharacterized protein n=1 Tax=Calcarisporiella thermophila TaxID=911321 RepID=UPI00374454F5
MPELPEVERARLLLEENCVGRTISKAEAVEDKIVFQGDITPESFSSTLTGRRVVGVHRYGKYFWMELDEGPGLVAHFGMTGNIQFEHLPPLQYRSKKSSDGSFPPRFHKFIITFSSAPSFPAEIHLAFTDPRRLGRVRFVNHPQKEPPISLLGFDPILSMPSLEEFSKLVQKRSMPIKGLLLDQGFSAGVGNWVADEVLFQSKIHPAQPANTLSDEECATLHEMLQYVCNTAVSVNADSSQFPEHWIFSRRWGKGKGKGGGMTADGNKIKYETIAGRTTAIVESVQKLRKRKANPSTTEDKGTSEMEEDPVATNQSKRKRTVKAEHLKKEITAEASEELNIPTDTKADNAPIKKTKRVRVEVKKENIEGLRRSARLSKVK